MDIRTVKVSLAVLAVALLVGVLSLLIIESRAVKDDYYVSHAERMRAVETSAADIEAVLASAENALEEGAGVSLSADLALARLAENNRLLQDLSDIPRTNLELSAQLGSFDAALRQFVDGGRELVQRQNALAASLSTLQNESPALVKHLRDQGLAEPSQRAFTLAVELFEFATGNSTAESGQMSARLGEFRNDALAIPAISERVVAFANAANAVLDERAAAEAALVSIRNSPAIAELAELKRVLVNLNQDTVGRSERAGLLLAVCAVLLLISAAYAIARLQFSYRELNQVNVKLEERVLARTEQLSKAYDDLKESQVQLIHAEKMSSLGEMVAGISHEINTPLWYLMNNSSVIRERLDVVSELCDVAERMVASARSRTNVNETVGRGLVEMDRLMNEGIRDDIDEAKGLVQDSIDGLDDLTALAQGLKDFSRLDRAQQGEFDVNDGLDRTLLIAKNKIKHKATVHKHYGDVPKIFCSPSQINQIFLNLLTNAVDSIDERGDIVIHTCEQHGNVEISITDTGCGIPADVLPKIRNPFFTTKEVGKGTGLGLSIVDRIIAEHGGKLRIESEPGKGTTVTVVLPAAQHEVLDIKEYQQDAGGTAADIDAAAHNLNSTSEHDRRAMSA